MNRTPKHDPDGSARKLKAHLDHFRPRIERNKTRRRRDDDPPAALPVPAEPRGRGPMLSGGAAAALTFDEA
jgi:hypothetical protein